MCRNHRGFVDASVAVSKLGGDLVYLNTGFAAPQLADVTGREDVAALIYDQEFENLLTDVAGLPRYLGWADNEVAAGDVLSLDALIAEESNDKEPPSPGRTSRVIILTSGTTGTPKGASRGTQGGVQGAVALLSRIPLHTGDTTLIAAPLFHSWGFSHFLSGAALGGTLVLQRAFDPEATLAAIDEHKPRVLVVVPVMMQRLLDVPPETRRRYDTSSLEVVAASGSALTGPLATEFMDAFGDVVYNLYGSTEVAVATIASPQQLRDAPGTAGSPPRGTTVKIFDADGNELPVGETGRIFVGNELLFEGYTGGGSKETINGLMSSGDVGHLDQRGLLFVEGRDDEMIVSGGENVFPAEVEDLLAGHDAVADVAVIGVDDEKFGQRLKAFVVTAPGASVTDDEIKEYVRSEPGALQDPPRGRVHRRAAPQHHRQGPEAGAARPLRLSTLLGMPRGLQSLIGRAGGRLATAHMDRSGECQPAPASARYIVTLGSQAQDVPAIAAGLVARLGAGRVVMVYQHALKGFAVDLPVALAPVLRALPGVAAIEPDGVVRVATTQTNAPWGLDRVDQRNRPLSGTYEYDGTGAGVKAYIIDTGINGSHQDFGGRVQPGINTVDSAPSTTDCNGHGTHVAGTTGGATYGMAKGVTLVAVRVFGCADSTATTAIIAGVDWVTGTHTTEAAVANMSLGGGASAALDTAVRNMITDGVTTAIAAGNENANACSGSPSRSPRASSPAQPTATTPAPRSRTGAAASTSSPPGSGSSRTDPRRTPPPSA